MEPVPASEMQSTEVSRRKLIRKAAYTAPAVVVIAAAPNTALGSSGPRRKPINPRKPRNGRGKKKNNNRGSRSRSRR